MKTEQGGAGATTRKERDNSAPSEQEKKLVAELRAVRMQAERQMREYDRVMAREAEK